MYGITFDIDWAPDFMVRDCMELCRKFGAPATFFATHKSDVLSEIESDPLFELGIHPNFLPGSSHGDNPREVMEYCLALAPRARSMRTHSLYQSSQLYVMIMREFPRIEIDVSFYIPGQPLARPIQWKMLGRTMTRLASFWDDYSTASNGADWEVPEGEGIQIFAMHPVHVALNSSTLAAYEELRRKTVLSTATPQDVVRNSGPGARTFLTRILQAKGPFQTVSRLAGV